MYTDINGPIRALEKRIETLEKNIEALKGENEKILKALFGVLMTPPNVKPSNEKKLIGDYTI